MRETELEKPVQGNDRAAALAALDDDQRKRLEAFAHIISQGAGDEPGDLFNAAVVRWLSSDKPIDGPEQTEQFLKGAMNSIRSNKFRHETGLSVDTSAKGPSLRTAKMTCSRASCRTNRFYRRPIGVRAVVRPVW